MARMKGFCRIRRRRRQHCITNHQHHFLRLQYTHNVFFGPKYTNKGEFQGFGSNPSTGDARMFVRHVDNESTLSDRVVLRKVYEERYCLRIFPLFRYSPIQRLLAIYPLQLFLPSDLNVLLLHLVFEIHAKADYVRTAQHYRRWRISWWSSVNSLYPQAPATRTESQTRR
jgi:hypothetical protein